MEKTADLDAIQAVQAEEYSFPYHYLPVFERGRMKLTRQWNWATSYLAALRLIADWLESLDIAQHHRHIDIGCGDGALNHYLSSYFSGGKSISWTGIDYDAEAIAWARMMNGDSIEYLHGDIADLAANSFDCATLIEVAEHIPPAQLPDFVAAIEAVIKPGGQLFLTVPHANNPVQEKHYQHFSFDSLRAVFEPHFDFVEIGGFARHTALSRLAQRMIANGKWVFTWEPATRFVVERLARTQAEEHGVSRIYAVLRPKKTR